jgi:cytoskeletal protein RodZ
MEDIARRTRISIRSIEAIEKDAFDQLPGVVFARNFVRLYALDLRLDPDTLVVRLPRVDIEGAPMPVPPVREGRDPWDPRITAALASVLWLLIAAATVTGAWLYYNHFGRQFLTSVAAAPAPKRAAPVQRVTADSDRPATSESPAPPETAPVETTPVVTTPVETAPSAFDSRRPVQVILTAREATWVQVTVDGQNTFATLLHPNDTRSIAADAQVKVRTGNAGGLDISLNGKPLDPLGERGQTRTIRLTAEGPQFVPQSPPASAPL